jgi:hypothetical protein
MLPFFTAMFRLRTGVFPLQSPTIRLRQLEFAFSDRKPALVNGNIAPVDRNIPFPDRKTRPF